MVKRCDTIWKTVMRDINESFNNNDSTSMSDNISQKSLNEQKLFGIGLEPKCISIEIDAIEDLNNRPISDALLLAAFIDDLNVENNIDVDIDWDNTFKSEINDGYVVRLNCTKEDALTILCLIYPDKDELLNAIDNHLVDCDVDAFKSYLQ